MGPCFKYKYNTTKCLTENSRTRIYMYHFLKLLQLLIEKNVLTRKLMFYSRYFLFEWLLQSTEGVHRKPEKLVAHQLSRPNMYGESCQTGSVHLNYTTKSAIIFTIAASLSRDTVMPHKSGVKYITVFWGPWNNLKFGHSLTLMKQTYSRKVRLRSKVNLWRFNLWLQVQVFNLEKRFWDWLFT